MFALAMMGPLAELLWGRLRLVLIYFVSGLAGSALAMALRPDTILAGASGAIWGIQMSLFAWLFTFRRHLPPELASDWFRRLSVVFVLNAGVSFLPNVSWEGHLGGGLAGFLVAGLLNAARFGDRPRRVTAWLLLALLPVLCVAGVAGVMDAKGVPGWQRLRQRVASEQEARAEAEFNKEVVPRLVRLSPGLVRPTEEDADQVLKVPLTKRAPERVIVIRARAEAFKGTADAVVQFSTREPTGNDTLDRYRERARAFGAARALSFERLLALLAIDGSPPADALNEWRAARREADRLWAELVPK
jgi:hypothetical protein